jgi:hypothetical protein
MTSSAAGSMDWEGDSNDAADGIAAYCPFMFYVYPKFFFLELKIRNV